MDIDEVLSRAETRTDDPESMGAADEFLSSFNVSNFDTFRKTTGQRGRKKKSRQDEGDPFWSELISEATLASQSDMTAPRSADSQRSTSSYNRCAPAAHSPPPPEASAEGGPFGVAVSPANRCCWPRTPPPTGLYPPEMPTQPLPQPPVTASATTVEITIQTPPSQVHPPPPFPQVR